MRDLIQYKPRLLYLSPVMPALTGNGLAMRAGVVLRALAHKYDVFLLLVPLYAGPDTSLLPALASACRRVAVVPAHAPTQSGTFAPTSAPLSGRMASAVQKWLGRTGAPFIQRWRGTDSTIHWARPFPDVSFDVIHVFRLAMLPFAGTYLGGSASHRPQLHLDLDEIESKTRHRLAALYRLNGEEAIAQYEETQAVRAEEIESEVLQRFDRVYVCAEEDAQELRSRSSARVHVLPNGLDAPQPMPMVHGGPFTFLFVGTLGYYPNADAVHWFCTEVLPLLRTAATQAFRAVIIGTGATPELQRVAEAAGAQMIGAVPDVAPWYQQAHAVVAPVRAGGGTRIKILEAFGYRRPVVSTTVGAEGLGVEDGRHLLLGDTPGAFAAQCLRLMADPVLAESLAAEGLALFRRAHTPEAIARTLAIDAAPRLRSTSR